MRVAIAPRLGLSSWVDARGGGAIIAAVSSPPRPAATEPAAGESPLIAGRYRVRHVIGEGGMGSVVAARNVLTGREVALKLARSSVLSDATSYARFLGEARAASMLEHPNVVEILDVVLDGQAPVIVMELLRGRPLAALLRERGPLELGVTARVLLPALRGLAQAHAAGLVHRDVKPANIFLARGHDGALVPKLVDFGIAKLLLDAAAGAQVGAPLHHTATGAMLGTPYYMSPEQVSGQRDVDRGADVWAAGVVIYECLTGERLFTGENFGQVFAAILVNPMPQLGARLPGLPAPLLAAVEAALQRDRGARAKQLGQLLVALEQVIAAEPQPSAQWREIVAEVHAAAERDAARGPPALDVTRTPGRGQLEPGSHSSPSRAPTSRDSGASWGSASGSEQVVDFCRSADGVRLAYASVGQGPPLVLASYWLSHLELNWRSPMWRPWLSEITRHHRLIQFDQRGTGLSDWNPPTVTPADWVRDLEAVVEAAGLERFVLVGFSQGTPTAVAYAARHPDRVTKLVLQAGFCQGWRQRELDVAGLARVQEITEFTCAGWGRDDLEYRERVVSLYLGDAEEQHFDWFNRLQRATVSAATARRLIDAFGDIDVLARLPEVRAPTLILHARDDSLMRFEQAELLAQGIPNSRLVPLASRNHITLAHEPAWPVLWREVHGFLGSADEGIGGSGTWVDDSNA